VRILLVEDNQALAKLLAAKLSETYVVDLAGNLEKGRYFLDTHDYDLLILDLILPDGNGLELADYSTANQLLLPILFLTAEDDLNQKIACLSLERVDYLRKPFKLEELQCRIRLLLNKAKTTASSPLSFGKLELNSQTHQVYLDKQEVKLNRKEFLLLELLLAGSGQIFSKAALAEKIWPDDDAIFSNSIETTISNLRRKLGKNLIRTVKGVGYALNSH
jgi:two-component system, OmpR family, response regulator BasR